MSNVSKGHMAFHEAAHAVVALHYRARVEALRLGGSGVHSAGQIGGGCLVTMESQEGDDEGNWRRLAQRKSAGYAWDKYCGGLSDADAKHRAGADMSDWYDICKEGAENAHLPLPARDTTDGWFLEAAEGAKELLMSHNLHEATVALGQALQVHYLTHTRDMNEHEIKLSVAQFLSP